MGRYALVRAVVAIGTMASWVKADDLHVPGTYPTIQAAINAAVNGDQVLVAPGTYAGSGNEAGDLDGDCDADLDDFAIFAGCLQGPGIPPSEGCEPADLDTDTDVDLLDFAQFQTAFGG